MAVTSAMEMSETSYNILNNSSQVHVKVTCTMSGSSYNNYIQSGSLNFDGQSYGFSYTLPANTTTTVYENTFTVYHNSDGTRSVSASYSFPTTSSGGTKTGSQSLTLTTIPRQSKIEKFNGDNIDGNFSVTYTAYSSNFTNKLRISIPSVKELEKFNYVSGTNFKLSSATLTYLYSYMSNISSVQIGVVVETWNGSTKIGESTELINNCKLTDAIPVCGSISYLDSNTTITAITGNNQRIARNLSNLKITLGTATAKKSATIIKYQVTVNGVTKEVTSAGTIDFGKINASSNLAASLKVIDSRGNSSSASKTIIIDDWQLPTAIIKLLRLNNYEDESYLTVNGSYSSVNGKNSMTIKYQYKRSDATSYSSLVTISNNVKQTLSLSKDYAWNFKVVVADKFGSTTYNVTLAKGMPIMFIDTAKLSIGVNCFPSENNSFEVDKIINGKTVLRDGMNVLGCTNAARKIFSVGGDANTYYPVLIFASTLYGGKSGFPYGKISISRGYSWTAPNTWYNSTHRGGLTFAFYHTLDSSWGGNDHAIKILRFSEIYCKMVSGIQNCTAGVIVWLRGGGAIYQIESDFGEFLSVDVKLTSYTDSLGTVFSPISYDANKVVSQIKFQMLVPEKISLYNNTSGTTGTVTLSETSANFTYLEIFFRK